MRFFDIDVNVCVVDDVDVDDVVDVEVYRSVGAVVVDVDVGVVDDDFVGGVDVDVFEDLCFIVDVDVVI